jgi:hypothetical protein
VITDSAYVMRGINEGTAQACRPLGAWAYRWRELWAIIADHGGLGDAAVTFQPIKSHTAFAATSLDRHVRGNAAADQWAGVAARSAARFSGANDRAAAQDEAEAASAAVARCAAASGVLGVMRDTQKLDRPSALPLTRVLKLLALRKAHVSHSLVKAFGASRCFLSCTRLPTCDPAQQHAHFRRGALLVPLKGSWTCVLCVIFNRQQCPVPQ